MNILILCTGNSCRSQMAEGFLKALAPNFRVYSAGTQPTRHVHPKAVQVMNELGIDLRSNTPKSVEEFRGYPWDYVITVCGGAKEQCPVFTGEVAHRIHLGFEDPAEATGTEEEILHTFRTIRDQILSSFFALYYKHLKEERSTLSN